MKKSAPASTRVTTAAMGRANCGAAGRRTRAAQTRPQSSGGASVGARWCESSRSSQSDTAVFLHQTRQAMLQAFVRAVEAGRHGPFRAAQHVGDLLVRQSFGVA